MPLQNRVESETNQLHGVNIAVDDTKLQFGWFTFLRNWIPGHKLKLKKKRGVDDVPTGMSFFTIQPCVPVTPPVITNVQIVCGSICPLGQFAEVTYDGSTQNGGPAIRMVIENTEAVFFGLVALYISAQNGVALVLYNGGPVASLGTVLATFAVTLVSTDVLRIEADATTDTIYHVKINGSSVITRTISTDDLDVANGCVGFVGLDTVPDGTIPTPGTGDFDVVVVKSVDQSVTSSTALVDDNELTFPIGASESWAAIFTLNAEGPDIKLTVTAPSGATGTWTDINELFTEHPFAEEETVNLFGITPIVIHVGVTNGVTLGTVTLRWTQDASSGTPTKVRAFSTLLAAQQP